MTRRDMLRVEAEFVAYLRTVFLLGNQWDSIGVKYGSWKGYLKQVVSSGEAFVTADVVERIIREVRRRAATARREQDDPPAIRGQQYRS